MVGRVGHESQKGASSDLPDFKPIPIPQHSYPGAQADLSTASSAGVQRWQMNSLRPLMLVLPPIKLLKTDICLNFKWLKAAELKYLKY